MKKFISALVAGILIMGTVAPVAAQTREHERFFNALDATFTQLSNEYDVVNQHNIEPFQFLGNLAESAHEMSVDMSVTAFGEVAGITQVMRTDETDNRFSSSIALFGLDSFFAVPDIAIDIYLSDDKVALGNSLESNNYFYLPRDITPEQWADTVLAEIGISYLEFLEAVELMSAMYGSGSLAGFDMEFLESFYGLLDPYKAVVRSHLEGIRITSQGEHFVPAQRGNIVTERLNASMTTVSFANLLNRLADTLEEDAELRSFLVDYFSMMGISAAEATLMINIGVNAVADGIRDLADLGLSANYSMYVATNGIAVRQAFEIVVPEALTGADPGSIVCTLDLLGSDFLINEMAFAILITDGIDEILVGYSQVGNNIMRGGVMEGVAVLTAESNGQFFAELVIDYFWDTNLDEDNFAYDMTFELDVPGLFGVSTQFSALWEGTYFLDLASNTFVFNSVISGDWGELFGDPDAYATFNFNIRSISPDLIGISGNGVNLAELTEDDQALILEFMELFNH